MLSKMDNPILCQLDNPVLISNKKVSAKIDIYVYNRKPNLKQVINTVTDWNQIRKHNEYMFTVYYSELGFFFFFGLQKIHVILSLKRKNVPLVRGV